MKRWNFDLVDAVR